jgi:murein DD-endopeptidase MepM/ murein hydrolase activator NlpD
MGWVWPSPGYDSRSSEFNPGSHNGIDIRVPSGSQIVAPVDGTVQWSANSPDGYGGLVVIETLDGARVYLAHLRSIAVTRGEKIKAGTTVGFSGGGKDDPMRGNSSGPHLHFEVRKGSGQLNPLGFFGALTDKLIGEPGQTQKDYDSRTPAERATEYFKSTPVGKFVTIIDSPFDPDSDIEINWLNIVLVLLGMGLIVMGVIGLGVGEAAKEAMKPIANAIQGSD